MGAILENKGKRYTDRDIEYLRDAVGQVNLVTISNNLKRPLAGIEAKAFDIGVNNTKERSDLITMNALAKAMGVAASTIEDWVNLRGLKAYSKRLRTTFRFQMINLDDFWEWACNHQQYIDTRKFEYNSLGIEPDWMLLKRKIDSNKPPNEGKAWTTGEEGLLIEYYNLGYDKVELAELFGRSDTGIQRKISRMKKDGRLPIHPKGNFMKDNEKAIIIKLSDTGLSDEKIGKIIGRPKKTVWINRKKLQEVAV